MASPAFVEASAGRDLCLHSGGRGAFFPFQWAGLCEVVCSGACVGILPSDGELVFLACLWFERWVLAACCLVLDTGGGVRRCS